MKRYLILLQVMFFSSFLFGQTYLSEGFEGGALPAGWSNVHVSGSHDWGFQNGDENSLSAHSGNYNAIFFEEEYDDDATKLITPQIDLSGATSPQLEFWHAQEDWDGDQDTLAVYYRTSTSDTWHYLGGWDNSISSWTKETFNLPSPSATYQIAFHGYESYGYGVVIDDIVVQEAPSCPEPSAQTESNITTSSADLSWTENGSATTWEIEWDTAGFTQGSGTTVTVNTNPSYALTGLSMDTRYDWYVRADCGSGSYSNWVGPGTFSTLPGSHSFPLTEDFESGFTYFDNASGNDVDFADETTLQHGGSHSVHNAYTSDNTNILHETGILDLSSTSQPVLEFWHIAKTEGGYDKCYVEISTDGGNNYTVLPASSYQGSASDYSSKEYFHEESYNTWGTGNEIPDNTWWKKEEFDLSSYKTTNVRFRFKLTSDGSITRNGWYIDDIHIYDSYCEDPSGQTESNVASTQADLGWTENGNATQWDIELGSAGFTPTGTPTQAGVTNPYTYTGLTAEHNYDWYVRADCGSGNYSNWTGPSQFTTEIVPNKVSSFPYTESFETDYGQWRQMYNDDFNWLRRSGPTPTDNTGPDSAYSGSVYIYAKAYQNNNEKTGLLLAFDFRSLTNPQLTFAYHMYGQGMGTLNLEASTDEGITWDTIWTKTGNQGNQWGNATVMLSSYSGDTNVYIKLWAIIGNSNTSDIAIDSIDIREAPSCPAPSELTENSIASTSAELAWIENGSATQWDIELDTSGFTPTGTPTRSGVTNPYTYSGLAANTSYDWYVRANCGGGNYSNWTGPRKFTTTISNHPVPFTEDFESGFTYFDNKSGNDVDFADETTLYHSGSHCVHNAYTVFNTNILHETGTIDLSSTSNAVLEFWHIAKTKGYDGKCYVQISTDGGSNYTTLPASTYRGLASDYSSTEYFHENSYSVWGTGNEAPGNTWWKRETFDLSSYNTTNVRIRFKLSSSGGDTHAGWYIDDIHIYEPSCPDPSALTESNILTSSADLGWTENGSATAWEIMIDTNGFDTTGYAHTSTTSNPYQKTGLSANTYYDWYVRANCGGGDYSNWTGPSTFNTEVTPNTVSTFPYNESFETGFGQWKQMNTDDMDWTRLSGATPSNNTGPDSAYSGSYYVYTESSDNYNKTAGLLLAFDFSSLTTPQLTFAYHMYGSKMGTLQFEVSTDNGSTWDTVWTKTGDQGNRWKNATVLLSSYGGNSNVYLKIWGKTGTWYTSDMAVDTIDIREAPSCPNPSDQTESNITVSSADLAWTDNAGASQWDIELDTSGFSPAGTPTQSGVTNPYTYGSLSENTSYDWYVRANCGGGNYSNWTGPNTFTTEVTPNTVSTFPYTESFESGFGQWKQMNIDDFQWYRTNASTSTSFTGPSSAYADSYFIYTESSMPNNPDRTTGLILAFDFSALTTPQLSFAYHMYGAEMGTLQYEVSTDNGSTWDTVWTKTGDQGNQWYVDTVMLSTYGGNSNVYLKIWGKTGSGEHSDMAVDKIDVREGSPCSEPSAQTESNITSSSADLSWTDNAGASQWDIELGSSGFTPTGTPTQSGVANPYTYSGLSANNSYDWYVRADCGNGSYSSWVGASTFTTALAAHTIPLTEDFESGFTYFDNESGNDVDFADETTLYHSGSHCVYNDYTNNNDNVLHETGIIDLSSTTHAVLEFWHIAKTEGEYDKCYVDISTDGGNNYTSLPASTYQGSASNYSSREFFHEDSYSTWGTGDETPDNTWWKKEKFDLNSYNTTNVRFRFRLTSDGSETRDGWYIDDIHIYEPSCLAPTSQTENNITSTSADLGWTENGSATTWEIMVDTAGFDTTGYTHTSTTSNPYHKTGLSPNTSYDWYVRADCGGGDYSNWTGASTFKTDCSTKTAPWSDDFEAHTATTSSVWGHCWSSDPSDITSAFRWDLTDNGSTPSSETGPDTAYNGTKYAYTEASSGAGSDSALLYSPFIDISGLTSAELTFYYHMYGADMGSLHVDIYDGSSWTRDVWSKSGQQHSSGSAPWTKATINLASYSGTIRVRFRGERGSSYRGDMSIDDFDIHETPSCPDPSGQTENNITSSSADLGWTENGSATAWEIMIDTAGFDTTGYTHTSITSNPYHKTGLSSNTSFDWYVRSDCGANGYSDWVGASTFTTLCSAANVPYFEAFDNVTAPDFPNCMTVENTNGDSKEWQTNTDNHSAPNSAKISFNSSEAMNDWFFTRGLNLTGGVTYEVNFLYKSGSSSWAEKLAVDWGNDASSTAMSGTPIFDNNNITNTSWTVGEGTFTPSSSGTYYVGFHGYSDADKLSLYVDDIQVVEQNTSATWEGSTDSDWKNTGNWSTAMPPGSSTNVTIPPGKSHYPTLTTTGYTNDLTIQSTSSGDGSLIGADNVLSSGTVTVQRYLTGGEWHDVAAMVDGATVNSFFFNHSPDVWMNEYSESTDDRTAITELSTAMPLGKGFEAWVKSGYNATAVFTGTINSGDVTPTLSFTDASHGYNLVGNPFSSAIQWGTGTWNLTNVNDQVWVWDAGWKDYVAGTSSGTLTNGIIPMGQGFFVRTNAAGPSMTIPADAQVHNSQAFYKAETVLPHLILSAVKDNREDQLWILFHEGSTTAYENGFDGIKMVAVDPTAAPQIYAVEESEEFSIDCLPPVDEDGSTIPVYFKANQNGEQTIEAKDLDLVPDLTVILEDTKLNVLQNLNKKPVYTFNAVTYQNPARFLLHLNRSANGIDENEAQNVRTFAYDGYLYIQSSGNDITAKKQLMVYDMPGRKLIDKQVPPGDLIKVPLNLTDNYVIVKIISGGKVYSGKVFIQ